MKSFTRILLTASLLMSLLSAFTQAQVSNLNLAPPVNQASSAAVGPAGTVSSPSALLVDVTPGPVYCLGGLGLIHTTRFNLPASTSGIFAYFHCPNETIVMSTTPPVVPVDIPLATFATGATTVGAITDLRGVANFPNMADGYLYVPPSSCVLALTTGTYAANPANSGAFVGPALVRTGAGNTVLQLTTTAAANTTELNCDVPLTTRISNKGAIISDLVYQFGYQTTALTSIGTAAVNTLTYPAAGGAAAATSAAAGGVITVTAGTSHGTPGAVTTTGQCLAEKLAFGTPIVLQTDQQRLLFSNTFVQSAAAATVFQFCGAVIHYQFPVL